MAAPGGRSRLGTASARQLGYIDRLLQERDHSGMVIPRQLTYLDALSASRLITDLEGCPRRPAATVRPRTVPVNLNGAGPGVYEIGGDVFRLRVNAGGTGVYPERLVILEGQRPRWQHAPEVARRILPSQLLTVPTAVELGWATGVCAVCGTPLEDPSSVAAGIGPKCARDLRDRDRARQALPGTSPRG